MPKRYFSVEAANRMIPELERAFGRLLQMSAQVRAIFERLEGTGFAPQEQAFSIEPAGAGPEIVSDLASLKTLLAALSETLDDLRRQGCIIKGIDDGLADWYATKDGRDVFLCWKLGEKEVAFWHEIETGFAGRRPVSEL